MSKISQWLATQKEQRKQLKQFNQIRNAGDRLVTEGRIDELLPFVMKQLQVENLSKELSADLLIYVGHMYQGAGEYEIAANAYHSGLIVCQTVHFDFHEDLEKILSTYKNAGREDLFEFWLADFEERTNYDKRFGKLVEKFT